MGKKADSWFGVLRKGSVPHPHFSTKNEIEEVGGKGEIKISKCKT